MRGALPLTLLAVLVLAVAARASDYMLPVLADAKQPAGSSTAPPPPPQAQAASLGPASAAPAALGFALAAAALAVGVVFAVLARADRART